MRRPSRQRPTAPPAARRRWIRWTRYAWSEAEVGQTIAICRLSPARACATGHKKRWSASPHLLRQARGELRDVDDGALVRAFADLLFLVARFHVELHPPAIHPDDLRRERHTHPDRRRRQVRHVDVRAH